MSSAVTTSETRSGIGPPAAPMVCPGPSYSSPRSKLGSSSGIFEPNFFVEIDDVIENKIMAFSKYHSQIRPGGRDADSIRSQAKYRGQEVGKNLCEAYYVHRFVI